MGREITPTTPGFEHTDIAQLMIVEPELNAFINTLAVMDSTKPKTTPTPTPAPTTPAPKRVPAGHIVVDGVKASMVAAFEFGYRCAEKGMNLQAALAHYHKTMGE